MKVRLVQPRGRLARYMTDEYWLDKSGGHIHLANVPYADGSDPPTEKLTCVCNECGQQFEGSRHSWNAIEWDTEDGELHVGDMHWADCLKEKDGKCYYWDNCSGKHLVVRVPDGDNPHGHPWNIDGRANNCTMKDERSHRCWVRHGEPPNVHVDKNGHTCAAGAGSILTDKWHGFLHNGELIQC